MTASGVDRGVLPAHPPDRQDAAALPRAGPAGPRPGRRHTGYRRYGTGQVDEALLIGRLRGLDLPLAEIGRLLAAPDPAERDAVLAEHLRRMERELDRTREVVASLRELLAPTPALTVEYRTLPELTVVTLGGRVRRDEIEAWCAAAFRRLHGRARRHPSGRPRRRHLRRRVLHRGDRRGRRVPAGAAGRAGWPGPAAGRALRGDRARRPVRRAGPQLRRAGRARRRARHRGTRPDPGDLPDPTRARRRPRPHLRTEVCWPVTA